MDTYGPQTTPPADPRGGFKSAGHADLMAQTDDKVPTYEGNRDRNIKGEGS